MDNGEYGNFEDIFRACGLGNINNMNDSDNSSQKESYRDRTTSDGNAEDRGDGFNFGCNDIPGGFQDLNPELFIVIGEILGNVIAGNMPFNVQNAVGNWLELVGQVILTYNAQQQYFQGGPGRFFNPIYYNVSNPFCSQTSNNATSEDISGRESSQSSQKHSGKNKKSEEIRQLKNRMENLMSQIEDIKKEINNIKNN